MFFCLFAISRDKTHKWKWCNWMFTEINSIAAFIIYSCKCISRKLAQFTTEWSLYKIISTKRNETEHRNYFYWAFWEVIKKSLFQQPPPLIIQKKNFNYFFILIEVWLRLMVAILYIVRVTYFFLQFYFK